jgi:hypothetical protein
VKVSNGYAKTNEDGKEAQLIKNTEDISARR